MTIAPGTTNGSENERLYRSLLRETRKLDANTSEIVNSLLLRVYLRELETTEILNSVADYLNTK